MTTSDRPRFAGIRPGILAILVALGIVPTARGGEDPTRRAAAPLPTPAEMATSLRDVWGEVALKQPDGPSFEFFKDLLPPLRYANTAFREYPVVLSAPAGPVKARWVSDGSGINLRADKKPMWK